MMRGVVSSVTHRRAVSRLAPARVLAICAVPLLVYEVWAIVGWLVAGPHQITQFRQHGTVSWYAARILEPLIVLALLVLIAKVVRDCRRQGRLTVDALLLIGVATSAFWDPIYNWFGPAWSYSSNWLNLNDWFAHAPVVAPDPDIGHMPWAVVPVLIGYPVWCIGFAAAVNLPMRALRRRRPQTSAVTLAALAFVVASAITAIAFGVFRALDLMAAPGFRLPVFGGVSEVLVSGLSGGLVFAAIACLRFFRGSDDESLMESGLDARRPLTSILASIAACQLIIIVGWGALSAPLVYGARPYPSLPRALVNGMCDAPGWHGTPYGPCPGSPGSRIGG